MFYFWSLSAPTPKQVYNHPDIMTENYDELYKGTPSYTVVILAGDANVGKTHIVYRFIKSGTEHYKNMAPTVGVEFSSKMVTLADDKRIKVQIWDTGTPFVIQLGRSSTGPSLRRRV